MLDYILTSHGVVAYLLVFGVLIISSLGAPIPEDLTLIVAGIISHHEHVDTFVMGAVCYLGIVTGDLIIYRIGWLAGPALFRKKWFRRHLTTHRLQLIRENLHRRTILTIMVARHLFYIRTATFLMCGAVRLSFTRFLIIDACAALVTTPVMMGIGYLFADNYQHIIELIQQVKFGLVGLGVVLLAYVLLRRMRGTAHRPLDTEEIEEYPGQNQPPSEVTTPVPGSDITQS